MEEERSNLAIVRTVYGSIKENKVKAMAIMDECSGSSIFFEKKVVFLSLVASSRKIGFTKLMECQEAKKYARKEVKKYMNC